MLLLWGLVCGYRKVLLHSGVLALLAPLAPGVSEPGRAGLGWPGRPGTGGLARAGWGWLGLAGQSWGWRPRRTAPLPAGLAPAYRWKYQRIQKILLRL